MVGASATNTTDVVLLTLHIGASFVA